MQLIIKISILILFPITLFSQTVSLPIPSDSINLDTLSEKKKLDPIKVNFLASYYEQDGIHSPVTGGIGDEELTDYVGKIAVYIPITQKVSITMMGGIDSYTSASTDNINNEHDLLTTETSASYKDKRKYGDLGFQLTSKSKRTIATANVGFSREWDVESINFKSSITRLSKNKNSSFKLSAMYYKDDWEMIYPFELRPTVVEPLDNVKQLFGVAANIAQVINKKFKASITIEPIFQSGLLSTPFHRVYFTDTTHDIERLPTTRFKLPIGIHASHYLNDWSILRFYYRFYTDDFGINAHTINLEVPIKVKSIFVLSPYYRFHKQTESWYFEPFAMHDFNNDFFTSDYDLSNFTAHKIGLGIKYSPVFGFFNKMNPEKKPTKIHFKKMELRIAKYFRMDDTDVILKAFISTLGVSYTIK